MGKNKRIRGATSKSKPHNAHKLPKKPNSTQSPPLSTNPPAKTSAEKKKSPQKQHTAPTIPFSKNDRILLVGEGDLSFAASLVRHHGCRNVTATVLEKDFAELEGKYPHVGRNINVVEKWGTEEFVEETDEESWEGFSGDEDTEEKKDNGVSAKDLDAVPEGHDMDESEDEGEDSLRSKPPRVGKVLYNIDATKMGPYLDAVAKSQGRGKIGAFDSIQFMFPHVGGKSTDINRQARYNQEMLVGFFKRAALSLAPHGSICVTLFEGEPYELWGIRNLARHVGLAVERSFVFQSKAYPGYSHARTLGVVRNKKGEIGGGWKGEDRAARTYIFRKKDELPETGSKKRKAGSDDEDEYD